MAKSCIAIILKIIAIFFQQISVKKTYGLSSNPYGTYFGCPIGLEFKKNYSACAFTLALLEHYNCINRTCVCGSSNLDPVECEPTCPKLCTCKSCLEIASRIPESSTFFSLSQLCSFNNVPKPDCFQGLCNKCPKAYFDLEAELNHLKQSCRPGESI